MLILMNKIDYQNKLYEMVNNNIHKGIQKVIEDKTLDEF